MRGLLYKDLCLVKSLARSYLFMILILGGMSAMGLYENSSFLYILVSITSIMLPMNTFAYDEQAKWDRYVGSTPAGRRRAVGSKYLFTLVILVPLALLCLAVQLVPPLRGGYAPNWPEILISVVTPMTLALLLNAILLPLLFRFGTQKARIFSLIAIALGTGLAVGLGTILDSGDLSQVSAALAQGLFFLFSVAAAVLSYVLSLGIYRRKEL